MLDERVDGNREKAGEEPENPQVRRHREKREMRAREQGRNAGNADRAKRDEAVFDFIAGEISRGEAAYADAHRQRHQQQAGLRFLDLEHVGGVQDDVQEQQRGQKPEIGVSDHREPQHPVLAHFADLSPQVAEQVGAEFSGAVRCGHLRDAEAGEQTQHGEADERHSGPDLAASENLGEQPAGHRAGNRREEGAQLENTVSPGEALLRQQLGQQPIFGRSE